MCRMVRCRDVYPIVVATTPFSVFVRVPMEIQLLTVFHLDSGLRYPISCLQSWCETANPLVTARHVVHITLFRRDYLYAASRYSLWYRRDIEPWYKQAIIGLCGMGNKAGTASPSSQRQCCDLRHNNEHFVLLLPFI